MPEYSGKGGARISIELLWGKREKPRRGPKATLDVETIVRTAIELADQKGLEAASMRCVATALGKGTMSLYTYVPGKGELLDLMVDRALGDGDPFERTGDGWRADLELLMRHQWAFYERHPWVLDVSTARAGLGPNEMAAYEQALATVDGLGLTGAEMVMVVSFVSQWVRSAAQAFHEARQAEAVTGVSDDDWWNERSQALEELVVEEWEDFPVASRLGEEEGAYLFDDSEEPYNVARTRAELEFGIQRVLDGLEAFIAPRLEAR
jgi:AcrR family transcriptional regulator